MVTKKDTGYVRMGSRNIPSRKSGRGVSLEGGVRTGFIWKDERDRIGMSQSVMLT